jgi:hypothetical protein
MKRKVAIFLAVGVSSGLLAGINVEFTAPLPQSAVVSDTSAYVGTWAVASFGDHKYTNDMQVIIRTTLNSNGILRATMTESRPDGCKTMDMPEGLHFYRIGKHVYLGSPRLRITTDAVRNTIFIHSMDVRTVTNHIAKGILTGTVEEWDHHSYIVKVSSSTEAMIEYLASDIARFGEAPFVVLKRQTSSQQSPPTDSSKAANGMTGNAQE